MVQRIGRKAFKIRAMDIETHNDFESIAKQETSMWLGCYIDENSEQSNERSFFYSIDEFLGRLEADAKPSYEKNRKRKCKNVCVYIYNLSFEWSFILPVLLQKGWKFSEEFQPNEQHVYNTVSTKSCSSVWLVNLKFRKNSGAVILRDLAKMYGGGLGAVAKAFKLETQKGEIDYRLNRLHGHVVTPEEKEYCFKDTRIIIDILLEMQKRNDKDFFKAASMASYSMLKLLKTGFTKTTKPYKAFRKLYPELSEEETKFLRNGVEGGICYVPRQWQFRIIEQKIAHIDARQMHPSSAYLNVFPYGAGEYFTGKPPLGKISACRIRIGYSDVRLHSIIKLIGLPFIRGKEITVWSVEIPTLYKCYEDLEIEYIDGYAYKVRYLPWREYYQNNFQKRLQAKREGNAFDVLYYKLLNNSSYGKLLEKPHNEIFENVIRNDGRIDSDIHERAEIAINAKYTYLPVGSLIPAYSRVRLIETAFIIGWEKVLYFDTDSIFFIWDPETEAAWATINQKEELGGWGFEEFIDRAQFSVPKRYKTETNGETTIKAGGINFNKYLEELQTNRIPFDEINIISSKWQVQRAYRVRGGTLIEFQEKEMKVPDKYISVYEKNVGKE